MEVYGWVGVEHVARQRKRARALRQSNWWKNQLGQGVCYHCQGSFTKKDLTMDHLTPVARGGVSRKGNVVVSCKKCNNSKKYYTPSEMILLGLKSRSSS